jgi:hypothetical protein
MFDRSYHFIPANRPKLFDRSGSLGADVYVFDLEDAVSRDEKPAALAALEEWVGGPSDRISEIDVTAIKSICKYIGIETEILETSRGYDNGHLASAARVIDICKKESADGYVNASGGRSLYSSENFNKHKIELRFLESSQSEYKQRGEGFTPGLSILDLLMFASVEEISVALKNYSLES